MYKPYEAPEVDSPVEIAPPLVLEPWRQKLLEAASIMETRGFAKGILETSDGRVCAAGALIVACGGSPLNLDAVANNYLGRGLKALNRVGVSRGYHGIVPFNNDPNTTKDDVVKAIREAAFI